MTEENASEQTHVEDVAEPQPDGSRMGPAESGIPDFEVHQSEQLQQAAVTARNVQRYLVGSEESAQGDSLPGLAGRLMETAGGYPGKYEPPTALSTHLLNAILVGVNTYVYDRVVREDGEVDEAEVRLLVAALALHDANKYVAAAYDLGFEASHNTQAVLDRYWGSDDFGLMALLPGETDTELEQDIQDVNWLVQRTETKEDSTGTRGQSTRRVRGLERYCRIGDGFVSRVGAEGIAAGAEWLQKFFQDNRGRGHVQLLKFTNLEQSLLTNHLLATVQDVVGMAPETSPVTAPTHGVVLGSTHEAVLYLGEPIERETLKAAVNAWLMDRVTTHHGFHPKTGWNAFEYNILESIDIPFEAKRTAIADGYVEELENGSGLSGALENGFESVPEDFADYLPELVKFLYLDQDYTSRLEDYPALAQIWDEVEADDRYGTQTRKMGFLASLLQHYTGAQDGGDAQVLREELAEFRDATCDTLRADLDPDVEAGPIAVERFFESGLEQELSLPAGDAMCFLCGRHANREYKKGNDAFYQTQSFSKRVEPEGSYKRICPVCDLEHALLRDAVEAHDYSVGSDIEIAFVYYDSFLGNLRVGAQREGDRLIRELQATDDTDGPAVANPELVASSFGPQYHLQPIYVDGENARLRAVHRLLETLVQRGFKIIIGKPFAGFRPEPALFVDLNPTRRQTSYGADRIASFEALSQTQRLLTLLRKTADDADYQGNREFLGIQQEGFLPIADRVAQTTEWYQEVRTLAHDYLLETHESKYMEMRELACEGLDLYGEQYDSRHKKTKVFRLAVDATLDGLNRGKADESLIEHVAGQVYKSAQEEDYAGSVTTDDARQFVETLFDYLRSDGSLNTQELSQRRNTLANTYLFAYDQLLNERNDEDATAAETTE